MAKREYIFMSLCPRMLLRIVFGGGWYDDWTLHMCDSFSGEMQLVHLSPKYTSVAAARVSGDPAALAVVAVLMEVSSLKNFRVLQMSAICRPQQRYN